MIFENEQQVISALNQYAQVPSWVTNARAYHKEMKALIYGDDFKALLLKIEHTNLLSINLVLLHTDTVATC